MVARRDVRLKVAQLSDAICRSKKERIALINWLEVRATDILEAEWTLVTVVADALVEHGTLTRKQFETLVTQTAQKAVTEAPRAAAIRQ
jgi:hypothetical protein